MTFCDYPSMGRARVMVLNLGASPRGHRNRLEESGTRSWGSLGGLDDQRSALKTHSIRTHRLTRRAPAYRPGAQIKLRPVQGARHHGAGYPPSIQGSADMSASRIDAEQLSTHVEDRDHVTLRLHSDRVPRLRGLDAIHLQRSHLTMGNALR
jgi:hypothetical protein